MKDCPVRSFCCKLTLPFLMLGFLLLVAGALFCNTGAAGTEAAPAPIEIKAPVAPQEQPQCTNPDGCSNPHVKPKHDNRSIDVQQREMKKRLNRLDRRLGKLKVKRKKLNNARRNSR